MNRQIVAFIFCSAALAQVPNPTQSAAPQYSGEQPVFRVSATSHTIKAVNFAHRQGSTDLRLVGTHLMPQAKGEVRVDSKTGATKVDASFEKMLPAQVQGDSFLTYVMWAITPEGRPVNLGEVFLDGEKAHLQAATELQAFGLIVTAEPYYAVTQPSDTVVMEGVVNETQDLTVGIIAPIDAKYELLEHGSYDAVLAPADRAIEKRKNDMPLDLKEAWNAVTIAKSVGAERYATDTIQKADRELLNAQSSWTAPSRNVKEIQTWTRGATQLAEDARIITLKRRNEERLSEEKRQADANIAAAQSDAERQAAMRAAAEAEGRRRAEEADEAKAVAAAALIAKADTDAAAARLALEKDQATREADAAKAQADKAEQDRMALRVQLRDQLNKVLETRDTARGLIVNMSDVLFDTAQYSIRPEAREKLAKISGILLSHPELKLAVEGHTDSTGGDDYNQKLSENRAMAVRSYLVEQGVPGDNISATGFGKTKPVASNDTSAGRQKNRRVEIVVSGDTIQAPTLQ
jgi:outer membrane protein OmpA-like peptidoglycan-associated protein